MSSTNAAATQTKQYVVVKVMSASLTKNFELIGRMDPAAVVNWIDNSDGGKQTKTLVSRTHTDWNSHKSPQWDYTCRAHAYAGRGSGESVEITLWEDDHVGKSDFMGSATILVDDLLGLGTSSSSGGEEEKERDHVLPLVWKKGQNTGTVTVRAVLVERDANDTDGTAEIEPTRVNAEMFVLPVKRLGVSGGTAPFFELTLQNPSEGRTASHYIGKDLSRAVDEIAFYEQILSIQKQQGEVQGLKDLLDFAFEYAGVLTAPEAGVDPPADGGDDEPASNERELLVLRNLRDGCQELRLLDLKMGQKTASAGWQGKSNFRAAKQGVFDKTTNSYVEGYRLEGFDGKPDALVSMDPLLDHHDGKGKSAKSLKKAGRLMLQHMTGSEVMMHFLDLHQGGTADEDVNLDEVFSSAELGEIVMHETVKLLARLAAVCQKVKVPQKWVGSSVALGYDCGALPSRGQGGGEAEAAIRSGVLVNVFDWGRSELNTVENESRLSAAEQQDRKDFWRYYKGGIERLSYVAAQSYLHRFGNADAWGDVTLTVYDFDAILQDDFMGRLVLPGPVKETPLTEAELTKLPKGEGGGSKGRKSGRGTLSYSIHWRPCPAGSRLKGTWRVLIKKAMDLPNMDQKSVSDPYCVVRAVSADGKHTLEQITCVKPNELNPVWDEVQDLPVTANAQALKSGLEDCKASLGKGDLHGMLPYGGMNSTGTVLRSAVAGSSSKKSDVSPGYADWVGRLQC